MKKLSIVIPAYNAEPYIQACIESIVKQPVPMEDYEIIVINDGSSDRTYEIAMELAGQYPQVKLIDQKNQGVGATRNNGAALACGEYIWYVDADDEVTPDALETIIAALDEYQPGVLAVTILKVTMDGKEMAYGPTDGGVTHLLDENIIPKYDLRPYPYAYIFNKSFWKKSGVRFLTHIRHEDEEWVPRLLFFAHKMTQIHKLVYRYLMRETSFTTNIENLEHSTYSAVVVAQSFNNFVKEHKITGKIYNVFEQAMLMLAKKAIAQSIATGNRDFYLEIRKKLKQAKINPFKCTWRNGLSHFLRSFRHTIRLRFEAFQLLYWKPKKSFNKQLSLTVTLRKKY